jgi:hypothetical protein
MNRLLLSLFLSSAMLSVAAAPVRNLQNCTLEDGSEATLQAQYVHEDDADRFYINISETRWRAGALASK